MKKTILIAGSSGLIGSIVSVELRKSFNLIPIIRSKSKINGFHFDYTNKNSYVPSIKAHLIINCAFSLKDLDYKNEDNINLLIAKNLYRLKSKNKIPFLINISSLSAFIKSKSMYGKLKYKIEQYYLLKNNCYSIRLGLPEYNGLNIGLLKKINFLLMLLPFTNIQLEIDSIQRISSLNKFALYLQYFLNNKLDIPKVSYFAYSYDLSFNDLICKDKYLFSISLKTKFLISLLKILNNYGINIFRLDSFIGLIYSPKSIDCEKIDL